jgi:hypothetical protein
VQHELLIAAASSFPGNLDCSLSSTDYARGTAQGAALKYNLACDAHMEPRGLSIVPFEPAREYHDAIAETSGGSSSGSAGLRIVADNKAPIFTKD